MDWRIKGIEICLNGWLGQVKLTDYINRKLSGTVGALAQEILKSTL